MRRNILHKSARICENMHIEHMFDYSHICIKPVQKRFNLHKTIAIIHSRAYRTYVRQTPRVHKRAKICNLTNPGGRATRSHPTSISLSNCQLKNIDRSTAHETFIKLSVALALDRATISMAGKPAPTLKTGYKEVNHNGQAKKNYSD